MAYTYNEKISVDWTSLLFLLERRYRTSFSYYQSNVAELEAVVATGNETAITKQAKILSLDCSNVIELAGLANSVRLFVGFEAIRYNLAGVRATRSKLRYYFEGGVSLA